MSNGSFFFGTSKHTGYFEYWVAGSDNTQDTPKFLVGSAERTAQICYLCSNQAFIKTTHQTHLLEVNLRNVYRGPRSSPAWWFFLSPQPHVYNTVSTYTVNKLCIFVLALQYCEDGDTGSRQAATLLPAPIPQNHSPMDCLAASKRWKRERAQQGINSA